VQCNNEGCIIDFDDLDDDEEFGDMESTSAVVDHGDGHGRLQYTFGTSSSSTGGDETNEDTGDGRVSVHCTSEGCTIDFDDDQELYDSTAAAAADSTAAAAAVLTDDDAGDEMISGSSIFECTLTGEEDGGGFECTAITTDDTTTTDDDPLIMEDLNLVIPSSSFEDGTIHTSDSHIRATTTPQRMMIK